MFRFANPYLLYLLLLVPLLAVLYAAARYMRSRRMARMGNVQTLRSLMTDVSHLREHLKFTLLLLAMTLLVLAAARPQFGSKLKEQHARGIEMMLAVDVSNSMLAEDFQPSRLERTKFALNRLFSSLQQDRVGLVVFAGEAKVQLPITSDYVMAKNFTKRLSPDLVAVQGTDIGQALSLAELSFSSAGEHSRVIILITDGEDHDDKALQVAKEAADHGIRIYTIGIGTPEGSPIQINGDFLKDENGEMVVSKLNEQLLQQIAKTTGGVYVRAGKQDIGLGEIVQQIGRMKKSELASLRFEEFNEQFPYLLAVALVLLLLEAVLLTRKNRRLARFNIFEKDEPTA